MNRLVAIFQYNDHLQTRVNNRFPHNIGWDDTNGPFCFFTVIQLDERNFTSCRVVNNQQSIDNYTVTSVTEYEGSHHTPFKLELIYE